MFRRRGNFLGNVAAVQDLLEDPLGQLVAAIRRTAAETGRRLEEPALAPGPENGLLFGVDRDSAGLPAFCTEIFVRL
jgi:hypothetical protein